MSSFLYFLFTVNIGDEFRWGIEVFGEPFFLRVFVTADMLDVEVYDLVKSPTFARLFGTS